MVSCDCWALQFCMNPFLKVHSEKPYLKLVRVLLMQHHIQFTIHSRSHFIIYSCFHPAKKFVSDCLTWNVCSVLYKKKKRGRFKAGVGHAGPWRPVFFCMNTPDINKVISRFFNLNWKCWSWTTSIMCRHKSSSTLTSHLLYNRHTDYYVP